MLTHPTPIHLVDLRHLIHRIPLTHPTHRLHLLHLILHRAPNPQPADDSPKDTGSGVPHGYDRMTLYDGLVDQPDEVTTSTPAPRTPHR